MASRTSTVLKNNWKSWRVKFEAYADLARVGAHLDIAVEQTALIKHAGLDRNNLLVSGTVHALLITRSDGKAGTSTSWTRSVVSAQGRVREVNGGKSYGSAAERHPQPTCKMGQDAQ